IALIASNWESIPNFIKLSFDFIILGCTGAGVLYAEKNESQNLKQWLILALLILILASIGLISQIYNTGGEFYMAAGFWVVLTLPLVIYAEAHTSVNLWIVGLITAVSGYVYDHKFGGDFKEPTFMLLSCFPVYFYAVGSLFHFFGERYSHLAAGHRFWSVATVIFATSFLSVLDGEKASSGAFAAIGILAGALAAVGFGKFEYNENKKAFYSACIAGILYFVFVWIKETGISSEILDAVLFLLIWFSFSVLFLQKGQKRLFDFFLAGVGIRFLIIYFQIIKSLAFTALGLIVSGILIIGLSWLYLKKREQVQQIMEKFL
ncbi:MAG TPA: DUF2157 domain-containing protein, partial [Leptospiraceae bacterium]|nr:DUF2157 domain-containing protein [Leptospiraceae bacterium]